MDTVVVTFLGFECRGASAQTCGTSKALFCSPITVGHMLHVWMPPQPTSRPKAKGRPRAPHAVDWPWRYSTGRPSQAASFSMRPPPSFSERERFRSGNGAKGLPVERVAPSLGRRAAHKDGDSLAQVR